MNLSTWGGALNHSNHNPSYLHADSVGQRIIHRNTNSFITAGYITSNAFTFYSYESLSYSSIIFKSFCRYQSLIVIQDLSRKEKTFIIEDYQLIRQIKKGDKQAFDTLVRKHYQNIYSYCVRRTGNEVIAADLTQDVFLKLIRSIYNYQYTGKFVNFLFTIAINTCRDYYKKQNQSNKSVQCIELKDEGPTPVERAIQSEQVSDIKQKINELPDMQKDTIILYYFHDMKVKDIAKIMGVKISTAKSRLKQGRDKLKNSLSEERYLEK